MSEEEASHMVKKAEIEFSNARYYKKYAATGAWGGVTPNGGIALDFYVDSIRSPESIEMEITEEGVHKEVSRKGDIKDGRAQILREFQTGVILTSRDAFSIGAWLMQKAVEAGYVPPTQDKGETH